MLTLEHLEALRRVRPHAPESDREVIDGLIASLTTFVTTRIMLDSKASTLADVSGLTDLHRAALNVILDKGLLANAQDHEYGEDTARLAYEAAQRIDDCWLQEGEKFLLDAVFFDVIASARTKHGEEAASRIKDRQRELYTRMGWGEPGISDA